METKNLSVVYIVRPGEGNPELKYSLRGIQKNLPHKDVWVVGYSPTWLANVNKINVAQSGTVFENSLTNIFTACETKGITSNFVLMHDDFHIVEPVDRIYLNHLGVYAPVEGKPINKYAEMHHNTLELMERMGVENPLNFELHMPFLVNKKKFLSLRQIVSYDIKELAKYDKISMYGNLTQPPAIGQQVSDVKHRNKMDSMPQGSFISTYDNTFAVTSSGQRIMKMFNEKGIYER